MGSRVAVQQWQGLIAINYPARKFGLSRHVTATEAKKLCPELVAVHVATWREGDASWAYHENAAMNIATHKVSLDPYRKESRRIVELVRSSLPPPPIQRVEKASVDEVFLDLSAQVHGILLERYPELNGPPPYDDPTEPLPRPPVTALDWATDALVDLDVGETEEEDPDWDDITMLIGSEIVRDLRGIILKELKYTCSGGIARNKMIAKLGAGNKKPNAQTVVRNRAVQQFLSGMKFTKIRNLGGKLGDEAVAMFNTDSVQDLLQVPLEQLKRLGDDVGQWLYNTIRGEDHSEVSLRTQIKSMLSAKSFRPTINTLEQARRWLRIFVADIFSRCVEEGVLEHKRKPKTINLHHRHGGRTRSKQAPIPQGKTLSEIILYDLAVHLLVQIVAEGQAWPCSNLSLSVGGFEDSISGNQGIGGFLVRGEEARAMLSSEREGTEPFRLLESAKPTKKRKAARVGIHSYFTYRDDSRSDLEHNTSNDELRSEMLGQGHASLENTPDPIPAQGRDYETPEPPSVSLDELPPSNQAHNVHQTSLDSYFCTRCQKELPLSKEGEHNDEHMARDLQEQFEREEGNTAVSSSTRPTVASANTKNRSKGKGKPSANTTKKGSEKGQKKLFF